MIRSLPFFTLLLTAVLPAQPCVLHHLTTPLQGTTAGAGVVVGIKALSDVTISSFSVRLNAGVHDLEVWHTLQTPPFGMPPPPFWPSGGGNPECSLDSFPRLWSLVGSASSVMSTGDSAPTHVPVAVNLAVPAGTYARFYIAATGFYVFPGPIRFTDGGSVWGNPIAQTTHVELRGGCAGGYPFQNPAVSQFNGTVHYAEGLAGANGCGSYQTNSTELSLTINGTNTSGATPAVTQTIANGLAIINASGANVGLPADMGITVSTPLVPGLAATPGTQILNLDVTDPGLVFLGGGVLPSLRPFVPWNLPLWGPSSCLHLSAQYLMFDPTVFGFLRFSQGIELRVSPAWPTYLPAAGPTGDDESVAIQFGCPRIPFYGTAYDRFHVSSNGRVVFGNPDTDFTATVSEFVYQDDPSVGYWTDLTPDATGTIEVRDTAAAYPHSFGGVTPAAGLISVLFSNVKYFGTTDRNTFGIHFDTTTGEVVLSSLSAISDNPGSSGAGDDAILGISLGNLGASDPGATLFSPGSAGVPTPFQAALYDFHDSSVTGPGRPTSLTWGTDQIWFTPLPVSTGYQWRAF
ncbi:MAG: hypothetical protein CMJ83_19595 [Planctomycetes bacterium]|nr:hypothetical protein [Planctomycetota bacterium]